MGYWEALTHSMMYGLAPNHLLLGEDSWAIAICRCGYGGYGSKPDQYLEPWFPHRNKWLQLWTFISSIHSSLSRRGTHQNANSIAVNDDESSDFVGFLYCIYIYLYVIQHLASPLYHQEIPYSKSGCFKKPRCVAPAAAPRPNLQGVQPWSHLR